MLNIGDLLENKYRIIGVLGKGAWGKVYLAENINLGNNWAIKEIDLSRECNVDLLAEPAILKKLNHRSLPRIVDVLRTGEFLYIIEDYFEGINLKELINSRQVCTEENAMEWAKQLCEILIYLHGMKPPLIYRDMKPGNIIIDKDNCVKLIDFGIAREYKHGQDSDSTFIGTRGYAAPEQFSAGQQSDERTDVYGLGATLYHVLTGKSPNEPPYKLVPARQICPSLSREIERIIMKCVELNPVDRYQSVPELMEDLKQLSNKKHGLSRFFRGSIAETKTVVVEKPLGTMVISVGGTNRGVGCTYTVISLATFLTRKRFKVAVCELNDSPAFYTLEDEDSVLGALEGSVKHHGVDYYKKSQDIASIIKAGYDYVILDLGRLMWIDERDILVRNSWFQEMNRADVSILVSGSALWQLKDLAPYLKMPEAQHWKLLFTTPEPNFYNQIRKETRSFKTFATVYSPDSFNPKQELEEIYEKLLGQVLPKQKRTIGLKFWK